jgi:hypothetical protein
MLGYNIALYSIIVLNTVLRTLTNFLGVLPKIFNLIDLFIVGWFIIIFLSYKIKDNSILNQKRILKNIFIINIIFLFGSVLNYEYIYFRPTISEILMLNEGPILFFILINLPFNKQHILKFRSVLLFILTCQIVIGTLQIPIFLSTGESEAITGTFQGNAEQYTGFIMVGVYYLLGGRGVTGVKRALLILLVIGITVMVDNKASWFGILFSILYLFKMLARIDKGRIKIGYVLSFGALFISGYLVAAQFSKSAYKFELLREAWSSGNLTNIGKVAAVKDVINSYRVNPHTAIVGSGPGTFYSRASSVFYLDFGNYIERSGSGEDVGDGGRKTYEKKTYRASDALGGVITERYKEAYFLRFASNAEVYRIGSRQLDEPWSSFVGLLGEIGILGTILYLNIYYITLKQLRRFVYVYRNDKNIFGLIMACIGFLIYLVINSIYNNWLETGRLTTILWSMIAMVYKYDEIVRQNQKEEGRNLNGLRVNNISSIGAD